ncbi:MAG: hypothetical protein AAF810_04900 [Cyanobacteria bacterium P01_D01_bin.36]
MDSKLIISIVVAGLILAGLLFGGYRAYEAWDDNREKPVEFYPHSQ